MSIPLQSTLDCGGARRIINLQASNAAGQPVIHEQLQAAIEGIAWKDSARVGSIVNVTLATPGASIDGITMAANDRVMLKNQTSQPENGIYIWNGAAVPMTRALDASSFDELEGAVINIEEGTNAGTQWRQTQVNGVIGTNNVLWTAMGSTAPSASEATAGILELATQGETDTGTDDARAVTPLKLATWAGRKLKHSATIGDAAATSIAVTHNFNTREVHVEVYRNSGSYDTVLCDVTRPSVNRVTLAFAAAPASNAFTVVVIG